MVVGDSQQAAAKFVRRKRQLGFTVDLCIGPFVEGQGRFAVVGIAVEQTIDRSFIGYGCAVEKARPLLTQRTISCGIECNNTPCSHGAAASEIEQRHGSVCAQQGQLATLWFNQPCVTKDFDDTRGQGRCAVVNSTQVAVGVVIKA